MYETYNRTADERLNGRNILAVIHATYAVAKRKPEKEKKIRLERESNP